MEVPMSSPTVWTLSLCTSISLLLGASSLLTSDPQQEVKSATTSESKVADTPVKAAAQRIDLSKATNVNLPATSRDLEAVSFGTPDGKSGWVLALQVDGRSLRRPTRTGYFLSAAGTGRMNFMP